LTTDDTTLGQALASFNLVQGFPLGVLYTYLAYSEEVGWENIFLPENILAMLLKDALAHPTARVCNEVDFFRLSPANVEESETSGVLCAQLGGV